MKFFAYLALLGVTSTVKISHMSTEDLEVVVEGDDKPEPLTAADVFKQCDYDKDKKISYKEGMTCTYKGVESMILGWWPKVTASPPVYRTFEGVDSLRKYMKDHPM